MSASISTCENMCCIQVGRLLRSHACRAVRPDCRGLPPLLLMLGAAFGFVRKVWNCLQLPTPVGTTYATPANTHKRSLVEALAHTALVVCTPNPWLFQLHQQPRVPQRNQCLQHLGQPTSSVCLKYNGMLDHAVVCAATVCAPALAGCCLRAPHGKRMMSVNAPVASLWAESQHGTA